MSLPQNKSFCLAPWVHLHALPNGKVMPCCFWDQRHKRDYYGEIQNYDDPTDLMNHDNFKSLRKMFLDGEKHPGCNRCYGHEDNNRKGQSMRHWFNETFDNPRTREVVANTKEDGTSEINMLYLDIRFGNICNLKCRMCGYELSSTWHDELIKLQRHNGIPDEFEGAQTNKPKFIQIDCYDKIEPFLETVEEIYFAGGEPLLYPEHLKMLYKLIELGRTDVKIKYNTNLTSLSYKGRDVVELWKKFDMVSVGASIDGMGPVVEYIRTGLNWDNFVKNFDRVKAEAPLVHMFPSPTLGVLNLEHFPDFNKFCVEKEWSKHSPFTPNFISWPEWQHPAILPDWYKDRVVYKYEQHIKWLEQQPNGRNQIRGMENVINYIKTDIFTEEEKAHHISELWKRLWVFNISGDLNWAESIPDVYNMLIEYKNRNGWDKWPDN